MGSVRELVSMGRQGLSVLKAPVPLAGAVCLQCLGWLMQLLAVYVAMQAFGMDAPLPAAGLVLVLMNIATIVPLWPGNIGLVQAAVALPLRNYGVAYPVGFAYGIVLQAIEIACGVGLGLIAIGAAQAGSPPVTFTDTFTETDTFTDVVPCQESLGAYDLYLRALPQRFLTREGNDEALRLLADGATVDTASLGAKTFTVTATEDATASGPRSVPWTTDAMNARRATAIVTGRTSGIPRRRHIPNGDIPSRRAASKSSRGSRRKLQ
jgi:hypothetical protein